MGESAQLYEVIHRAFIKLPGPEHIPMNDVGVLAAISVPLGFTRGVDRVQAGPDKIA